VLFNTEIQTAFGLETRVNVMTNVFFLGQTILLYVLLRTARRT